MCRGCQGGSAGRGAANEKLGRQERSKCRKHNTYTIHTQYTSIHGRKKTGAKRHGRRDADGVDEQGMRRKVNAEARAEQGEGSSDKREAETRRVRAIRRGRRRAKIGNIS